MAWTMQCRKCVFVPRTSYTSALFKVLVTLKLLHGSRQGARGSTLEDIAMHMIKHFCLDGDVKSQVLASLKYGVKMHFIHKRKDKFSLITPASSIPLAPCKCKSDEISRIMCLLPAWYHSNPCQHHWCGGVSPKSCCGKDKSRPALPPCCQGRVREDPCCRRRPCSRRGYPCGRADKPQRVTRPPICHQGSCKKLELCKFCPPPPPPEDRLGFVGDTENNCTCCLK